MFISLYYLNVLALSVTIEKFKVPWNTCREEAENSAHLFFFFISRRRTIFNWTNLLYKPKKKCQKPSTITTFTRKEWNWISSYYVFMKRENRGWERVVCIVMLSVLAAARWRSFVEMYRRWICRRPKSLECNKNNLFSQSVLFSSHN